MRACGLVGVVRGVLCCGRALRQVPFVRLDCVEDVTSLFADCLSYMESHLELGDSDDEAASEDEEQPQQQQQQQQHAAAEHKLSSRATSADRRNRDEQSSSSSAATSAPPAVSLPAAPAVDSRGRLGLGVSSATTGASVGAAEKVPVLPPAGLATKLIGSTVTRDYSSPSQSKRSLGGGLGSKRGSITLPSAVNLSAGTAAAASTAVSPSSTSSVSPTSSSSSTPTLPPSASLTNSTSSSGSSTGSGSSSSPSSKLGLGLGLKGPGGLMSSNAAAQTHTSSSSASAISAPAALMGAAAPPTSSSSSLTAPSAAAGPSAAAAAATVGVGVGGKQIGLGHRPSSRAQYSAAAAAAAAAAAQSTDDEELKEGASGGSGPSSGQNSDTDDEVIRVARPLGGAPKNKLLHRAAAGLGSREYPSPKLGPRSLGASPAGMGPRGMSAPNNQQQQQAAGAQQQLQPQQSSHQQRAPTLSHAASTGSAPSSLSSATDQFLSQAPSLSSPPSLGPSTSSSSSDVDVLPEPSASLRDDDNGSGLDDAAAAVGALVLTEAAPFVKEKQLSDKEALNIPESEESEEKDLVDEALERRPDPLQKLKNEVIVAVTASPKQYRSSLKLLTLAAESAQNNDGTVTPPEAEPVNSNNSNNGNNGTQPLAVAAELSSHRLNPLLNAASLPSSFSSHSLSPSQSASNTPKPAFLRRLDSPESHHGQLIAAKAKLQMMINRAMQTIPQLKKDALPAVHAKLEAALAKLEASTIQP